MAMIHANVTMCFSVKINMQVNFLEEFSQLFIEVPSIFLNSINLISLIFNELDLVL